MSIFTGYLSLFMPSSFLGVLLLRWYALEFLYRTPEKYWTEILPTLGATIVIALIVTVIAHNIIRPFDKIIKRIKEGGSDATEEERKICLSCFKKMIIVTIVAFGMGFFVGQIVVLVLEITSGITEYYLPRLILSVVQAVCIGGMGALYTVLGLKQKMSRYRRLLKIHTAEAYEQYKEMKFSSVIFLMFVVMILFIAVNLFTVPFQLLHLQSTAPVENALNIYLSHGVVAVLASLLPCLFIAWSVLHGLAQRIAQTTERVQDIAGKGDLSSRLNIAMLDDYGNLTGSINVLIKQLSIMVRNLQNGTDVVSESSETLTAVTDSASSALVQMNTSFSRIDDDSKKRNILIAAAERDVTGLTSDIETVNRHVFEQTSAVQQSSSSISEMSSNIASVAEMTKKADAVSTILSETSGNGAAAITTAVTSIEQIQTASREVEEIIKVIQKIASQTNLLSMNAAIEAAHAGKYGQGFAVVADEVRSLAASSAKSAHEIQIHIKEMVEKIDSGVDAIAAAGRAFREIEENVQQNHTLISTIASAMSEQQSGAEETLKTTADIVEAIQSIKDLTQKESTRAANVREVMQKVVNSSRESIEIVSEGVKAAEELHSAIEQVEDNVQCNRKAVDSMKETVAVFKV